MTKQHIITILCLFFLLIGIYVYKDANIIIESSNSSPFVKQENIETIGYENGKKIFEVKTKYLKQKTYHHVLYATGIINGRVYNQNGKTVIDQISGNYGRINTSFKSIYVTDNIKALIYPSTSTRIIHVFANEFRYNHQEKRAHFSKSANLNVRNIKINSDNLDYYNDLEILFFEDGLSLFSMDSQTNVSRALIDINTSLILASQNVETTFSKRKSKSDSDQVKHLLASPTIIKSEQITIDFSDNDKNIITYKENVNINQNEKQLTSDQLNLNFKTNIFEASKNTQFTFENLNWLIKKKRTIKNKNIKKILAKKTKIKANKATFYSKKNELILEEDIELKQQDFKLTCDFLNYDIDNEVITLTGHVSFLMSIISFFELKCSIPNFFTITCPVSVITSLSIS